MTDFLLNAHSGWRFLVLLVTLGVALFFAYALATQRTSAKNESTALKIWAGVVDMQFLLGLLLLISKYALDGVEYWSKLTGHWVLGVVLVLLVHVPTLYRRLNGEPNAQTRRWMGLGLPVVGLVLAALTILAIQNSLFSMS